MYSSVEMTELVDEYLEDEADSKKASSLNIREVSGTA